MSRPTFADPKTDFAFKRIFGSEEHKDVLIAFLNHMLDLDEPHRIVSVELLPAEQRPAVAELKLSIVDVKCTDSRGVTYVVEMQVLQVEGFEKRVVYNVAKAYVNQIARGDLYPELNDVVGITICDFELWPEGGERRNGSPDDGAPGRRPAPSAPISSPDDGAPGRRPAPSAPIPMLSRWRMTEERTGAKELGQIRLVFLELPKYGASGAPRTLVEKWAYFFREAGSLTMVPEVLAEHPFVDALEAARTAEFTKEEWDAYILAGIALQNERGALAVAERRGEQRGREQGLKDGRESGLRIGIEALCGVLGIELTEERRRELTGLDAAGLSKLLAHLQERKSWT